MAPKTKIIDGHRYKKSENEFTKKRAYDKAKSLRKEGYRARVEPEKNGKYVVYVCAKRDTETTSKV